MNCSSQPFCYLAILLAGFGTFEAGAVDDNHFNNQQTVELEQIDSHVGMDMPNFILADFRGREWSSAEFKEKKFVVVAFLGIECPLVKFYGPRLQQMQDEFDDVAFIGVNSNQHDSIREMEHFVRINKIKFPMLKDVGNRVADSFKASRTPEVFLFDADRKCQYHGRIDDQFSYGVQRDKADNYFLKDAIRQLLAGKSVSQKEVTPVGCRIGRILEPNVESTITYSNQISRILQTHCVTCHRAGAIAPFQLTEYDEVVGWASMIEEVVRDQRMPPWHADSKHGQFKNDPSLTDREKDSIYAWVAAGAPKGDEKELPTPATFETNWQIGRPDAIIKMDQSAFEVPATGVLEYQYFVVDPGFKEDRWVKAAECRPGNPSVVHHIIVGVKDQGEFGEGAHGDLQSEWIAAFAPGAPPLCLPDGYAKLIPAGAKLVFQLHYTPNGRSATDISEIGLEFADEKEVKKRVLTLETHNHRFEIPAGDANHVVRAKYRFDQPVELLTMFPHMHYRGKSFRYDFEFPDGSKETLLNVPRYDFNWQNAYDLNEPRMIPKGTLMRCKAVFDNSAKNLMNPNPKERVGWGDQTSEEMMIGYFNVAVDRK